MIKIMLLVASLVCSFVYADDELYSETFTLMVDAEKRLSKLFEEGMRGTPRFHYTLGEINGISKVLDLYFPEGEKEINFFDRNEIYEAELQFTKRN